MFFMFLHIAYRSLEAAAFSDFLLRMSFPEDSPVPPENHEEYFSADALSKLNELQICWLATQGRELRKSIGEVLNDILCEWFVRHPAARSKEGVAIETARIALDTFIASHHAEFLPVEFSK
jgi:hypothetical protein